MWLHQRLQEIHATDLAWLNEIENRVKRAMARIDTEGASTTGAPQSGDRSQSPE